MKKAVSLLLIALIIALLFCSCSSNYKNDYGNNTSESITTSSATTTSTTSKKEAYYPTEEEYMRLFDVEASKYDIIYNKSYDSTTNSIMLSWDLSITPIVLHYSLSLVKNEDNRIVWCTLINYQEKFLNNLSIVGQVGATTMLYHNVMPVYILACLHNDKVFNEDELGDIMSTVSQGLFSDNRKYDSKILNCDYYATMDDETGITGMLDYGGNVH